MLEADTLNGLSSCLRNVYEFQTSVSVRRIDGIHIFLRVKMFNQKQRGQNRHPDRKGPPYAGNKKYARTENHEAKA